ncbi:hypothetical protein [Nocardioides cynanchi]|uniref:hypothetical protein n=1 Tax=Nocardioides cynanchi TaxID=2558918 RepID=UPI001244066A|nr:hypothetical protein [Nocardioides cynanchi]
MTDYYRVAAFPRSSRDADKVLVGKQHAYLEGVRATVCGFGLVQMRRFEQLPFSASPPSERCLLCDRVVRAASH